MHSYFDKIYPRVIKMLEDDLPEFLFYHNADHTIDVVNATVEISQSENISSQELDLLRTAALLHDTGYTVSLENHEEESCVIAVSILKSVKANPEHIEYICRLIRATKVPQKPEDKLAEILCDADLDYLGRDDYFERADLLFRELMRRNYVKNADEWNKLQVKFLENHSYFTNTSNKFRSAKKLKNMEKVKDDINDISAK